MKTSWTFRVDSQKMSLQPNKNYKQKIMICTLIALISVLVAHLLKINTDIYRLLISIGIFCAAYALYDFIFKLKLTYVFDLKDRKVYQKVPGLFSRKLMNFDEACILLETDNCEPHYVLSKQNDRYGKNFAISDYFSGSSSGQRQQQYYETEVLVKICHVLYANPIQNIN